MKHTYEAVLPNNVRVTRTTARTYTHIVAGFITPWGETKGAWEVVGFCGSLALAHKSARQHTYPTEIIPVVLVTAPVCSAK